MAKTAVTKDKEQKPKESEPSSEAAKLRADAEALLEEASKIADDTVEEVKEDLESLTDLEMSPEERFQYAWNLAHAGEEDVPELPSEAEVLVLSFHRSDGLRTIQYTSEDDLFAIGEEIERTRDEHRAG